MTSGPDENHPPTVLVIEDDAILRRGLSRLFTREGFRTLESASGAEVLSGLSGYGAPELIICDYRLPEANGLQVIRSLKSKGIAAPFILITAYFTDELRLEAIAAGAISVMEKPLDLDVLVDACRNAVRGR
ncbi:MAG TPA: response regulator [Aridibacter sp.]|nr:response regulator [Aridibacter sp.]